MPTPSSSPKATHVALVYSSALLHGLTVVSFPASSTVLKGVYGLSDADYGSIFLPQTAFTIVGSLVGGALAKRFGLRLLLFASLVASVLAELALGGVQWVDKDLTLVSILVGTACMGLGFGLAAAPLNTLPGLLFPHKKDPALVALHTILGMGFAAGPVLVSTLVEANAWGSVSVGIMIASGTAALATLLLKLPEPQETAAEATEDAPLAWGWLGLFGVLAVLYAFAEGTFSNWASIYLHDARGVDERTATYAISGFWGALTVGRLVVSALLARVSANVMWLILPVAMLASFLLLPTASNATSGIGLFVLAGLSASAFFPLTVAIASDAFPGRTALVSSLLTAALMVGVGSGTYLLGTLRDSLSFDTLYRVSAGYPAAVLILAIVYLRAQAKTEKTT